MWIMLMIDSLKVISGQGMPSYRHHELGDLYVQIKVNFPASIDPTPQEDPH
jgi:DnaJ family protein A protein 2